MTALRMIERLSTQDGSNLRVESRDRPMHVAGLAILEGEPLLDSRGRLRLDALRGEIASRLPLAPRLRQVLYRPGLGLGPLLWVDDASFDVARHVRTRSVPPPGDEAALLATVQDLNAPPLARSRPLWELWLLTGLEERRAAMLIRLHHVVADGIAALALLGSLFDSTPDASRLVAPPWRPLPVPSRAELLADNFGRRRAALVRAASSLVHPCRWLGKLRTAIPLLRSSLGEGLAPRSFLNGPLGAHRRLLLLRADLERAKAVAHAHGAKVNDVVLAAVSGGARELLRHRGELVSGLALRAMVPVSQRSLTDPSGPGNLVAVMTVPVPVGEPDAIHRLEEIAGAASVRKGRPISQWARFPSLLARLMDHQRFVNLFTSNVPGPPVPVYFAGARVVEIFQVGVLQGNVRLGVGALSYAGHLNFDIMGDADSLPDLDVFAEGMQRALKELDVIPNSAKEART